MKKLWEYCQRYFWTLWGIVAIAYLITSAWIACH